ncbi:MAG: acyltransferase [Muribaculaceae bacterium]
MDCEEINIPEEFKDICPISDNEFHEKMSLLVDEPGFEHAVRYVMPDVNYSEFVNNLLKIQSKSEFQINVMTPFLELLASKTTGGITAAGLENMKYGMAYTNITNHRDIVLDASFLNLVLLREKMNTTEVAIGNNLLIYDWIDVLVKLNKSFIVRRDLSLRPAFEAAVQLSNYIHFTIAEKNQSVWIAQREGRAKDSNDLTQESVVKMLGIGGGMEFIDNIKELNIMPVSISYEYDPNDYLKAKEFLLKRDNPDFKKSQRDDLFSMETGLLQYKGRIHFEFTPCLNAALNEIEVAEEKTEAVKTVATSIDKSIHSHYKIYPCNYIAHDIMYNTREFADKYTHEDELHFNEYVSKQLAKIDIDNLTEADNIYLKDIMIKMYANPLSNKLHALSSVKN